MKTQVQHDFSVILLVAGVGRRLDHSGPVPKVLLDMGGKSLIARHLALLAEAGAREIVIVTGFMANDLEAEVKALNSAVPVRFARNPRFREGSLVSLGVGLDAGWSGEALVLMDGDVLYDRRMHARLLGGAGENILLVDRNIESGDEPVKICFDKGGTIVDFRKRPAHDHVWHGESVGFFRFSPEIAEALRERARAYDAAGDVMAEYEEAIRDLILGEPARFAAADVSDLPWTEIDFPEDVERARREILPALEA